MKALAMYIFCGSLGIGIMQAGFKIDRVLEITDEMLEENSKHFMHNYPDIPVIKPSLWNNTIYKNGLFKEDYDLLAGNPPCSGLSQINRHASSDNLTNQFMYNFIDTVSYVQPKTFMMENAPTLISKGKVILDYLVSILGGDYYICIVRDYAGNHLVPMRRQRTMVLGFRKNIFQGVPVLKDYKEVSGNITAGEVLSSIDPNSSNMYVEDNRSCKDLEKYLKYIKENKSIMHSLSELSEEEIKSLDISDKRKKNILTLKKKLATGKGVFDKTPFKLSKDLVAPSMTSLSEFINPVYDRHLYIREYAKLMGYPDNFEFVKDAKVPYIQSIAQGVPVNFAKWAAMNIKDALEGKSKILKDIDIVVENRCNPDKIKTIFYSREKFFNTDNIC